MINKKKGIKKILQLLAVLAIVILPQTNLLCQDIIILKNGDEIEAKVTEIDLEVIRYKRANHLDGPSITLSKADIFMIKYENGMKDVFGLDNTPEKKKERIDRSRSDEVVEDDEVVEEETAYVPMVKLTLRYPGKKIILNRPIRIFADVVFVDKKNFEGNQIGEGGFKDGFEVTVDASIGRHNILLLQGDKAKGRIIWSGEFDLVDPSKNYTANFKYNSTLGKMVFKGLEEEDN